MPPVTRSRVISRTRSNRVPAAGRSAPRRPRGARRPSLEAVAPPAGGRRFFWARGAQQVTSLWGLAVPRSDVLAISATVGTVALWILVLHLLTL
jgi:hypothetical protein